MNALAWLQHFFFALVCLVRPSVFLTLERSDGTIEKLYRYSDIMVSKIENVDNRYIGNAKYG